MTTDKLKTLAKLELAIQDQSLKSTNTRIDSLLPMLSEALADANLEIVPGWQDIETAPKDGTDILGYTPRNGHMWRTNWVEIYLNADNTFNQPHWSCGIYTYQPTHWRPLPTPPTA